MSSEGIILTIFDDREGFVPLQLYPNELDKKLVHDIIFRSTLNIVGGTTQLANEREAFIDVPEHKLIGCSYMNVVDLRSIRGGKLPVILILIVPVEHRNMVYNNLANIMDNLRKSMNSLFTLWNGNQFKDTAKISTLLKDFMIELNFTTLHQEVNASKKIFTIQCPDCSSEIALEVPLKIKNLLTIPVIGPICKHQFDTYFTTGPSFRGTSKSKTAETNENLKDIFDKL